MRLTEGERRVLLALCRPLAAPGGSAIPAGNREIAEELHITPDGVKTHIRALFAKLGIADLPQYRKRTELARRALESGLITQRDLARLSGRGGRHHPSGACAERARRSMLGAEPRSPMPCPSPSWSSIPFPVASGVSATEPSSDGRAAATSGSRIPFVSRRHARVMSRDVGTAIEDLGSANGLYVNGRRSAGITPLHPGDVLQLGGTLWLVQTR